jgi:cation diffusion facilitator family transporter
MAMDHAQPRGIVRPSKAGAALYSVLVNIVLIAAKLLVGLLTGSVAILADAAHSFLDLSASIFAYAGIRTAAKPADEDHAWGHAKAENISSLIQMFLLGATCIAIVIESVRRLVVPGTVRVAWYSFVVVLAAVIIDIVVSRYLQGVSRAHGGSAALDADALHFASDLWASLAVLAGITIVAVFNFQIADPLAGIAVAIIIGTTAIEQGRQTPCPTAKPLPRSSASYRVIRGSTDITLCVPARRASTSCWTSRCTSTGTYPWRRRTRSDTPSRSGSSKSYQ